MRRRLIWAQHNAKHIYIYIYHWEKIVTSEVANGQTLSCLESKNVVLIAIHSLINYTFTRET